LIGIFDSGVGGLSVLTEVRKTLPEANLLYVADRARAPYGTRSLAEVESISQEVAGWLRERGATCLVVACNTASAAALESLRSAHPDVPVVGMEPAVKPAAAMTRSRKVAVLATAATFQGRLYESVVSRFASGVEVVTRACPQWVEMVEAGVVNSDSAETAVAGVVDPLVAAGVDVIVLACTHFAFLRRLIESRSSLEVIDPAPAVAAQVARVATGVEEQGTVSLAASGDTDSFSRLARALASIDEPVIPFAP
jgi:glutamate racemase